MVDIVVQCGNGIVDDHVDVGVHGDVDLEVVVQFGNGIIDTHVDVRGVSKTVSKRAFCL